MTITAFILSTDDNPAVFVEHNLDTADIMGGCLLNDMISDKGPCRKLFSILKKKFPNIYIDHADINAVGDHYTNYESLMAECKVKLSENINQRIDELFGGLLPSAMLTKLRNYDRLVAANEDTSYYESSLLIGRNILEIIADLFDEQEIEPEDVRESIAKVLRDLSEEELNKEEEILEQLENMLMCIYYRVTAHPVVFLKQSDYDECIDSDSDSDSTSESESEAEA